MISALSGEQSHSCYGQNSEQDYLVRWYSKYGVSHRDLEEMMEERGVDLGHTTLYRWVQRYAAENRETPGLGLAPPNQVAGMSMRPTSKYVVSGFISNHWSTAFRLERRLSKRGVVFRFHIYNQLVV